MASVKIELNSAGVRELLQSAEMMEVCEGLADHVAGRCGPGYAVNTMVGKTRVNAMVYAETMEARLNNLKNNTILKAVSE